MGIGSHCYRSIAPVSWASVRLSIALGRHVSQSTIFLLVIVRISGLWSMNAFVTLNAFRDLHASFVCGRLSLGHLRALITCE